MKNSIELIIEERRVYEQYNPAKNFADDLKVFERGIRQAVINKDPRLISLLAKLGGLVSAEIDRLLINSFPALEYQRID